MSDDRNGRDDDRSVVAANIGAAIVVLLLILGAYWLIESFAANRKVQDCFLSGRHDCVPIDENRNG
ncbi:MAG: hypothetical protein WAN51_07155 [Alphaproteobacteria bacterium]